MKTVVALFDSFDEGRNVIDELGTLGIQRDSVRIANESKGEFAFDTSDEFDKNDSGQSLISGLIHGGVPRTDAEMYAEGVRRGGTLVVITLPDEKAQKAYDLLKRQGSIDIMARGEMWKKTGWTGYGTGTEMNLKSTGKTMTKETELRMGGKEVVPVIEEELKVGKREVESGGVRVKTMVTEKPVTEQVHLREEHVRVERHPVDRAVSPTDVANLRDRTIEMREKSEEAVVSKRARVIEEVVIGKEVSGRTETVKDTVKRTDVKVEKLGGMVTTHRFEDFDTDFRTHYKGLKLKDSSYDEYLPVYRFGYGLGSDERYSTGDWTKIEPEARRTWETRNPGTWEEFKDTIRYAWDKVRGRR